MVYFEIINQNYNKIGKNGTISLFFYDENLIKQLISEQSFVPKDYIINLFSFKNYGYYSYSSQDFYFDSTIYAMINDTYNSLYSSISSLSSLNNSLRNDYNALINRNSDNERIINDLTRQNQSNQSRIDDLTRENRNNHNRINDLSM